MTTSMTHLCVVHTVWIRQGRKGDKEGANSSASHYSERLFIICIRAKSSHWLCLHCLRVVTPPQLGICIPSAAQISDTFPCQCSAAAAFPKVKRGGKKKLLKIRSTLITYGAQCQPARAEYGK
ncbi:hypothetical protein FVEG_15406 [Fusarium verticillioides 7600]|uniref:Uncharacterized protein n=1 Tax=Gibberella moniliformis (strain M3125 / FGSC 7600) TaxID=334819 RepID=W7MBG6_GIBM7|nr:hypothetical protein FVEG_15406 [Fusarium verticillioides 7600]EWG42222.1 hypothetical protein FVEG_15406 [Fusarium verticillioides 7600]